MNTRTMNTSTITNTVSELAETVTSTVTNAVADIAEAVTSTVTNTVKRLDATTLEQARLQLPAFQMPTFQMPAFEASLDTDRIAELARDAAYVGVGAIVVAAQQADETVRSVAGTVTETLSARARDLVDAIR